MTLDPQLRAALTQEADMLNAPAPDLEKLIRGGRARQRRRKLTRLAQTGVAAAVAVLLAGGVYGVVKTHDQTSDHPGAPSSSTQPVPYPDGVSTIQPGRYRMLVGNDDTGAAINADLTLNGVGWQDSNYPVVSDGPSFGAVAVYQPVALAAGTGCLNDRVNDNLEDGPQALAQQLTGLPASTVVQAPTPVQAFGRPAVHLRLRITPDCGRGIYRIAMTLRSGHGISYGDSSRAVVVDFWVLEIRGTRVIVDTWHQDGASGRLIRQIARAKNSISFTGG
jgi:hypothetical protein